jgi:hypothetical protein
MGVLKSERVYATGRRGLHPGSGPGRIEKKWGRARKRGPTLNGDYSKLYALEETEQVNARAARLLRVSERLWYKLKKHGLT